MNLSFARRHVVALGVAVVVLGGGSVTAAFAAGPPPPPPPHQPPPQAAAPMLSSGNNCQYYSNPNCASENFGSAASVNEGLGGQGALLTSISGAPDEAGYGLVSVKGAPKETFGDLTDVSTQYDMTQGACTGGAPRWQVDLLPAGDHNMNDAVQLLVYFGNPQPYGCSDQSGGPYAEGNIFSATTGWWVGNANSSETTSQVEATYGAYQLVDVQIAVDAGWDQASSLNPGIQQVLFQDLVIDSSTGNATYYPLPS